MTAFARVGWRDASETGVKDNGHARTVQRRDHRGARVPLWSLLSSSLEQPKSMHEEGTQRRSWVDGMKYTTKSQSGRI